MVNPSSDQENPYQPPRFDEDSAVDVQVETDVSYLAIYASFMVLTFLLALVTFHSFSPYLGTLIRMLAMLFFGGFAWHVIQSLLRLFKKF